MRIAPHFSVEELTRTDTGLPNVPDEISLKNLHLLARVVLEPIRDLLGCKLLIHSAFRSEAVNCAVGGSPGSAHLEGRAADFRPVSEEPIRLMFEKIRKSGLPYDKLILEQKRGSYWIHVQIPELTVAPRRLAYLCQVNKNGAHYQELKNA